MTTPRSKKPGVQIPLRLAMILGSAGLMLVAVAGVLYLGYQGARETTVELLSDTADAVIDTMQFALERELNPVVDQAIWIAHEFESGRIGFDDPERLDAFIQGTLAATPDLMGLALFTSDYTERRYHRDMREGIVRGRSGDEGFQRGIDAMRHQRGASWKAPIWVDDLSETVINLQTPLFKGDRFVGVLIQGVSIGNLSRKLSVGGAEEDIIPFVLYDKTSVLAHPMLVDMQELLSDSKPLPDLASFDDGILSEIWGREQKAVKFLSKDSSVKARIVPVGDMDYVFLYRELSRYADKPLTLGVYFEHAIESTEQVVRLYRMVYFGIAILVVSMIAALLVAHAIGRPIVRLSDAAEDIRAGNLDRFEALPRTPIRELTQASLSFNGMVVGLQERNLVRGLLGKYVPEGIVKKLIVKKGALEPLSTEATVLFSDIAGFTAISEKISPREMVDMLNEYFTVLADILEAHSGVIAQFQGDGLLAMFNAPVADPEHAANAVRSAMEIQTAVRGRLFAGHQLSCRVGLATGEVVVGSVGASDRLSYTVYGDTVNLASRLEQMNKQCGTAILLPERTEELAGDFPFERIGEVEVRGKAQPVTVYTVAV